MNNTLSFSNSEFIKYKLQDNNLYAITDQIKIKISNRKVSNIIKIDNDGVYYIAKDTLYYFNLKTGEEKLISYNEWNFNYTNMIYIFD